jgi:hypothetical protein
MAFVESSAVRLTSDLARIRHRKAVELCALAGTSLAFLFVLAIAFGAISA